MKFVDEIQIRVRAGHGGAGAVHFLREKFREFGGPDGGDGGWGGSVFLHANPGIETLGHLMRQELYAAKDGEPGRAKNCSGANAEDLTLHVPVGTEVIDVETDEVLGDMDRPGKTLLVASGGKGGLGNQHFATSVNQAPQYAQSGLPGEEKTLILNLKLLADVGLVGLPNAGKSTLLSAVSRSHPKIADYAFTTLIPNLGIVEYDMRRLLLADIPGIIEGASRGAGLGLSFLRHIERVRTIVYIMDILTMDVVYELQMLRSELSSYSPELLKRKSIIVLNKMDQIGFDLGFAEEIGKRLLSPGFWAESDFGLPEIVYISAKDRWNLDVLLRVLFSQHQEATLAENLLRKE